MKSFALRGFGFLMVGIFLISSSASAKSTNSKRINLQSESVSQTSIVARVFFSNLDQLSWLAGRLDVWEVDHAARYLVAMLSPLDQHALIQAGYRFEIDPQKTARLNIQNTYLPGQVSGIPGFPCYRTVEETYASLEQLLTDYPDLVSLTDIGDSWEKTTPGGLIGYDIYSIILTNQATPGPKPKFFLMAAIHAREYATAELATRFAEYLLTNYGIDPDITWLLDYYEIHIVPHTNPDGRKIAENGAYQRKNTDNDDGCIFSDYWGVDLNRNSSYKWAFDNSGSSPSSCAETYRGPSAASEPETMAIQNYVSSIFPDQRGINDDDPAPDDAMGTFITLHSYGEWVLFPWGWEGNPAPNDTSLETLGRKFGYLNKYLVCQSGEPGCIYATNGSTDDWAYGELGLAAYTFEIGTAFFQSCSYFENTLIQANLPALLYAFKSTRQPYLDPSGPETLDLSLDSDSIQSGSPVTLTATADDTRFDSNGWGDEPTQSIQAARFSIDAPSWESNTTFPLDATDGTFDASVESMQTIIDTTDFSTGRHLIFVESQDASGAWGVPSAVFLTIEESTYNFELSPSSAEESARPGETVTYLLTITNTGASEDNYVFSLGEHNWETSVVFPETPLPSGESAQVAISITIPSDSTPRSFELLEFKLVSQGDPDLSTLATLVTRVDFPAFLPLITR
jgi:hypothetical protein